MSSRPSLRGHLQHPMRLLLLGYAGFSASLGLLLGWLVIRDLQWGGLTRTLSSAHFPLVFLSFATILLAGLLRGLRWKMLLAGHRVSALRLFFIEQTGSALDTLSPVHVLDEVVQVGILTLRDRLQAGVVLATLAVQRSLEFATTILVLTSGAFILAPLQRFWPYLATGLALSVAALGLLFTIGPVVAKLPVVSKVRFVVEFAASMRYLRRKKRLALGAFALSICQAILIGVAGWLVAKATGIPLGITSMVVITLGIQFFSSSVPGLPMAVGTFEFGAVFLLGLWGTSREEATGFAVVLHAVMYLAPIAVTLVFLPREGLFSLRRLNRLAAGAKGGGPQES
ncbi:MAG: flippase-like domain-containing protein [Chloroflexi bacterium]|nr:flippase-like domain-containing protein [Chloroflexota bacterium]